MRTVVAGTLQSVYYALLRPSQLVSAPGRQHNLSRWAQLRQIWSVTTVYLVNLVLFAGPLTLAGIGIQSEASVPGWLTGIVGPDPGLVTVYLAGFLQNSLYLFGFTLATLLSVHLALVITLQSKGILWTVYSVVYSTSAYLAGIFTVVWYLTTATGVDAARGFVIDIQVAFIYWMIDIVGAELQYSIPRPGTLSVSGFSPIGEYAIVALVVLIVYFVYSLYLGARINHNADRIASIVTVLVVSGLPVAYVFGSILLAK